MILSLDFFKRPTLEICPELLGKFLIRKIGKKEISGFVTEAEAYVGMDDKACHAARGKTKRNAVMFEPGGIWYVYLCYGMYWMLNIVTEEKDFPAAILIRGIKTVEKHFNGPGKLTTSFQINKGLNGKSATPQSGLWFEDRGVSLSSKDIKQGKRIGINYAGSWQHKPWRFFISN
ncbi:MAG: hypothetical protein A2Z91_05590 [Deltaproteobacteria bacterium GWA2_38_16]|nr:MAG: hypothetical protein A2Z91_05590 [Deltaproteobacteria bacterium GWA2_38_16]OGQ03247.1 MAG: hypothetical protein A3D19_04315 [Deltaproteobacteria bacterium RIFCSPHIGHO2_02_FULL_38_15]OGQ34073.1 MAG: hypothetical protein A3A72_04495 [Deltaproteobacteria bacterium RIFCSPLOWO2_01_FULL_38_9]OGQ58764.1 MAG: hypothetical protein A3G92_04240 [Deltaproteobacteria bacterium RIFCSPLOWO2_12_FULL_38_8]HBQ21845.1 3-methyladenine DNA glycosylase [Deltaproteobacteria bacterium]